MSRHLWQWSKTEKKLKLNPHRISQVDTENPGIKLSSASPWMLLLFIPIFVVVQDISYGRNSSPLTHISLWAFKEKKKKKTQGKLHLFLFFYQLCHSLIQYSRTLIFVTSKTSFLFSISVFPLLFAKSKTSFFFSINVFPLCKQNDFALLSPQGVDNQVWRAFRGMILYASHFDVLCTRP